MMFLVVTSELLYTMACICWAGRLRAEWPVTSICVTAWFHFHLASTACLSRSLWAIMTWTGMLGWGFDFTTKPIQPVSAWVQWWWLFQVSCTCYMPTACNNIDFWVSMLNPCCFTVQTIQTLWYWFNWHSATGSIQSRFYQCYFFSTWTIRTIAVLLGEAFLFSTPDSLP